MRNRLRILKVLIVVAILSIMNMAVFLHVSGDPGTEIGTRQVDPDDEFLDFDWENLPSVGYPGDRIEFQFTLDENYNAEGWEDDYDTPAPGGAYWIWESRVTISTDAPIVPAESNLVPSYAMWNDEATPNKYGHNFTGSSDYWAINDDYDPFFFTIDVDDLLVGDYTFTFSVQYRYYIGYNWANESPIVWQEYNTSTRTEVLTLDFEVRSCLNIIDTEPMRVMYFTSTSTMPLYAGAKYQKVGVRSLAQNPEGELKNVSLTLTIPNSGETAGITLTTGVPHMGSCFIMDLYGGWQYFYFYIDVAMHMPAGEKEGAFITVFYEREFDTDDDGELDTWIVVTETFHYEVTFMVEFTPILDVPEHNYGQDPLITIDQKNITQMKQTLAVDFVNNGNVDLFDITVTLYLQYSYYFDEEFWYHMETSGYYQDNLDPEVFIGDLTVGSNFTAVFDLSFFRYMPPATYALRIYYEAIYYDDGSTGNPTQMIETSQSIYDNIKDAWGYETSPFYQYPYVIVEVTDVLGLDMYGYTGTYNPGAKGVYADIYVFNKELYGISDITVTLDGNGFLTDPIWDDDSAIPLYPNGYNNNDEHSILGDYPSWSQDYGGTYWYDSQRTFRFFVDVADDAADDGAYKFVYLDISGYDKHHNLLTVRVEILITFANSNPNLLITEAFSPDGLNPKDEFYYQITITNVGGSVARNITVLLRDNQDIIHMGETDSGTVQEPVQNIGDLEPGESATFGYYLVLTDKALNTAYYNDRYTFSIYWGFTTERDVKYDLGYDSETVYMRTSPLEQVDPVQEVTPTFSSDQSQVLSYLIFAIAIIVGALVLMFGMARLASNVNKWRYEDYERKMGKTEKAPEASPDMKEPAAAAAPKGEEVPEPPEAEDVPEPPEDEEEEDEKKKDEDEEED